MFLNCSGMFAIHKITFFLLSQLSLHKKTKDTRQRCIASAYPCTYCLGEKFFANQILKSEKINKRQSFVALNFYS